MSSIQIPNLPAVIGLNGSELFEGVQAGTSVKISLNQMIAATRAGLPTTLPLSVSVGGTGLDTFTIGDIMYASATQTLSKLADVALGNAIISGGVGAAPSYGKIGLTTHVSGVLPVANGGTGVTSSTGTGSVVLSNSPAFTGQASFADGTAAAPSIAHTGDLNAGLFFPAADTVAVSTAGSERMRISSTGVVGIGVTPSPWDSALSVLQLGGAGFVRGDALTGEIGSNAYFNGTNFVYTTTAPASRYRQSSSIHSWSIAPSGTAGNTITFTQAMTLDASGNLGIGTTTPSLKLDVRGGSIVAGLSSMVLYGRGDAGFPSVAFNTGYFALGTNNVDASNGGLSIYTMAASTLTERFRIAFAGQFGIGGANYGTAGQTIISAGAAAAPAWGTLPVAGGGTGAITLTGYVKGTGTAALTASATIPNTDISGLGTMSTQAASAVVITGGTINGTTVGATTASTGAFTTLSASSTVSGTGFSTFLASPPAIGGTVASTGAFTSLTSTSGGINGTVGATTASTGAFTTVTATTSILSSGTGGVGYSTGAGGTITQVTSRTTGVTLSKTTGQITLFSTTTLASTFASFTVTNSLVAATDVIVINFASATTADRYSLAVTAVAAGSFRIQIHNIVAVAVAEAPVINFAVIKGVNA